MFCPWPVPRRAPTGLGLLRRLPDRTGPSDSTPLRSSPDGPRRPSRGGHAVDESIPCRHLDRRLQFPSLLGGKHSENQAGSAARTGPQLLLPSLQRVQHGHSDAALLGIISRLQALRLASRPLSIFRGSWWLVGFGFNALMLVHESNQPPTNFNDSGDTSRIGLRSAYCARTQET